MKKLNYFFIVLMMGLFALSSWAQDITSAYVYTAEGEKPGKISGTNILFIVPAGTDLTNLYPKFVAGRHGVTMTRKSPGGSQSRDFSNPVTYELVRPRALMGTKRKIWTITVKVAEPADITDISIVAGGRTIPGTISGTDIFIFVPPGTNVRYLKPTINIPKGATISPASGIVQDFRKPVTYTVTAEDGSKKTHTVTVTIPTPPGKGKLVPFSAGGVSFNMVLVPIPKEGLILSYIRPDRKDLAMKVDNPYLIGETEVTYELWCKVITWAEKNGYSFKEKLHVLRYGRERYYGGIRRKVPDEYKNQPVSTYWRAAMIWTNALTEWYNAVNKTKYTCVYYTDSNFTKPIRAVDGDVEISTFKGSQDNPYVRADATGFRLLASNEWILAARYKGSDSSNGAIEMPIGSGYWWTPSNYASGATADYTNESATKAVAWYGLRIGSPYDVKKLKPNLLGLYDMSGNLWEWCFDSVDIKGRHYRIRRGGGRKETAEQITWPVWVKFPYEHGGFRLGKTAE